MRLSTINSFGLVLSGALGISAAPRPDEGHDTSALPPHAAAPSAAAPLPAPGAPWATNGSSPANLTGGHVSGGEKYIVLFDTEHPEPPEVAEVLRRVGLNESHPDIDYVFNNSAFRGFAGSMNSHCIDALNDMTDVKHVDKSVTISTAATESRVFAPWGLQRISQQGQVTPTSTANQMKYTYKYERTGNLGQGVDIYVVDTGVNTAHLAFGGRARMGFSKDGASDLGPGSDQAGHGTHCAGTAAANIFGVASLANIIGVKVLGADGSGSSTDVMRGIDWLVQNHNRRKAQSGFIGSVASMSFGLSGRSPSLEAVINAAVDAGIHISVAAGNEAQDACLTSPAANGGTGADGRGGKAVSVGAMNINEQISGFSNTGRCVDVYAPGETVISTWIGGNDRIQILSGTSMAAPRRSHPSHVQT